MAEVQQILPVAGAPAVFAAKARAFFKAHREHRLGKGRFWVKVGKPLRAAGLFGLGVGGLGLLLTLGVSDAGLLMVFPGLFFGIPATILGFLALSHGQGLVDQPEVVPDLQRLLRALADDWAAKQPLHGEIDLRAASDAVPSERSARSPYSGATKLYYRHRWFRAAGRLVDGTALAIEGTALVKTKSGHAIRRELQLRGRLRPGALLRKPSWHGERRFGRLRTVVDGDELLFWGPVQAMDDVLPDLERIVGELAGLAAPPDAGAVRRRDDPAGGAVGEA